MNPNYSENIGGEIYNIDKYIEYRKQKIMEELKGEERSTQNTSEIEESLENIPEIKLFHDFPDTWSYFG